MTEQTPVFEVDGTIVKRLRMIALCITGAIFALALFQMFVHAFSHDLPLAAMLSSRNLNSVFSVVMLLCTGALAASLYEEKVPAYKYLRLFSALTAATIAGVQLDKAFLNLSQMPLDSVIDLIPEQSVWLVRCFLNPGDAVSSILIALGLLTLNVPLKRPSVYWSDCFCIAAILTCLMSLIGWVFGVPHFCLGGIDCQKIAPAIPLTLTCLGAAVLLARPERGVVSVMSSANAGGVIARFWFPAAIGVPLLLGYLRALGQEANLFDRDTGLTILVLVLIATFYFFILWFARRVDHMDAARKLTSERLAASEQRTRHIIESAIEAYVSIDGSGVIVGWNNEATELFGWSHEEAVGAKLVEKLVPAQFSNDYVEKISAFLQSKDSLSMSKRMEAFSVHKDGHVFPIEMAIFPVHWDEGINYCAFVHDISDRREAEARVSEFYSIVSHELRTPLTSIKGALGMIDGGTCGEIAPKASRLVTIALQNCNRLVRLINDILDIRKIEAGKMELDIQELDVEAIVNRVIEDLQPLAAASKLTLIADLNFYGSIKGDPDRVTQILTNLVSNAIKFSSADGKVTIRTTKGSRKFLRFNVIDEGPGIPANQIHKLFGKFSQLDSSMTRKKGGTGLGLAISKALVEQHGGVIGVDSVHTKGSTFWFELALVSATSTGTRVKAFTPVSLNRVVGVVADSKLRETIAELLSTQGVKVDFATTIDELNPILESLPDAIVWDIDCDIDLLDRLSLQRETQHIPVVVLCDQKPMNFDNQNGDAIEDDGIKDWLVKPIVSDEFVSCLRRLSLPTGAPRILIVDDDLSTREILSDVLSSGGFRCLEAADGAEGISIARNDRPDLIILDVGMPRPDGFEVVSILRQERAKVTPLITYSARELSSEDKDLLTLGPTTHFTKAKTSSDEILEAVKDLIKQASENTEG